MSEASEDVIPCHEADDDAEVELVQVTPVPAFKVSIEITGVRSAVVVGRVRRSQNHSDL